MWTIEAALQKDAILKHEWFELGCRIWLRDITQPVDIFLFARPEGRVAFHTSHVIHTPEQGAPYDTSRFIEDDLAYALHRAIDSLTQWYDTAVKAGHKPSRRWLVRRKIGI